MEGVDGIDHLKSPASLTSQSTVDMLYDGGDSSAVFIEFKVMVDLEGILYVGSQTQNLMMRKLLQLG